MITAIDTNVLVAVLEGTSEEGDHAATVLDRLATDGPLIVAPVVYAELLAGESRSPAIVDALFRESPIRVDWALDETIWRSAGLAYRAYSAQRRIGKNTGPRRILADFIIRAHAYHRGATLLTWDDRLFPPYFPELTIVSP